MDLKTEFHDRVLLNNVRKVKKQERMSHPDLIMRIKFYLAPIVWFFFFGMIVNGFAQSDGTIFPDTYGEELIQDLQQAYKPATVLSYDDARDTMFAVIDNHNGVVTGVYSGMQITLDPNADPSSDAYNKDMNTEHTWPQSMGADQGNAKSDLHHLFPARIEVNSSRGNDPYDEIDDNVTDTWWRLDYSQSTIPTSYIDEYSEKDNDGRFEPREDHNGNAARAVFYFYTMYRDQADSNFFNQQKDILRVWNLQDTVDQAERERSQKVAQYQDGKENPFVLDTTLVRRAYFSDGGSGNAVDNPSNFTAQSVSDKEIDLSWTRNANRDDVMIVWNTSGTFDAPVDGTTYSDGESALGGTIIGRRADTTYAHTGLTSGTTYYYRAFSVHGSSGSETYSGGVNASATAGQSATGDAQPGDVVITEIMQNPSAVYDSDGEWFEIYNTTDHAIDLEGWYIKDDDTDQHRISNGGSLIINAGDYLVLGVNSDQATNGGAPVDYQYSGFTLANGADEVVLVLADGVTEIDRVMYDGGPNWPDPTGASMYFKLPYSADNNDPDNWTTSDIVWNGSAGDKGSPGYSDQVSVMINSEPTVARGFRFTNYPNPFNPETRFEFYLKRPGRVTLDIYDLTGRRVVRLADKMMTPGNHYMVWQGVDSSGHRLSSGVYLAALRMERKSVYRKVVLIQ